MQTLTPQLIEQRLLEDLLGLEWGKASGNEIAFTVADRFRWMVSQHSGVLAGVLLAWLEHRTYEQHEIAITASDWRYLSGVALILLEIWNLTEAVPRLQVLMQRMPRDTLIERFECESIDRLIHVLRTDLGC